MRKSKGLEITALAFILGGLSMFSPRPAAAGQEEATYCDWEVIAGDESGPTVEELHCYACDEGGCHTPVVYDEN